MWETYLYQLDTDEDGPPAMPAGVRASEEGEHAGSSSTAAAAAAAAAPSEHADENEDESEPRLSGTTARDSEDGSEGRSAVAASEDE